tara:strand:- start:1758 stop:2279 length:522 start_codon:yes stop_codon:yes gene_type:complete
MKKLFFLFLLILKTTNSYSSNVSYLDVQYIIDNSDIGLFYKKKLKKIQDKNANTLKPIEDKIKNQELEIKNKKNILNESEIENKINKLNNLVKDYQINRKELNKKLLENKKKYTSEILKLLNPLLTNYVEKNNILIVLEKKNILIGIKSLDITSNLLELINNETKKRNLINEN